MRFKSIGDFLLISRKRNSLFYDTLKAELKSDHAGEYGAVRIYDGIVYSVTNLAPVMAVLHRRQFQERDRQELLSFALEHRQTELKHLQAMEQILPDGRNQHTKLIPLWRSAGFLLGLLPALVKGPVGVYQTVAYVEEFVDKHYQFQIDLLNQQLKQETDKEEYEILSDLRNSLIDFQSDEKSHMQDAQSRYNRFQSSKVTSNLWKTIVQQGSIAAVYVSKKL